MALAPGEFEKRLDGISQYGGMPYGRVHVLFDCEDEHANKCIQFKGYLALSDAFKSFGIESFNLLNDAKSKIKKPLSEFYPIFLPQLVHAFQTMCGAERAALKGYPLHAYTLLRNNFDNVVLTSGGLQKIADLYSIQGLEPRKQFDPKSFAKLRRTTESLVRDVMTGANSGLPQDVIDELKTWDTLFDWETHGARLSLVRAMEWMKGNGELPYLPSFRKDDFVMFMNRYCEVGWMVHRLFPAMQPLDAPFPQEWKDKWRIIDESFALAVQSLSQELGKKIGDVMAVFVKAKFPFSAETVFPL